MAAPSLPVTINESSLRINLLHKALQALGYPVDPSEVGAHQAGDSTLRQVRAFQEKMNIQADPSVVVDKNTYDALVNGIRGKNLTASSQSFTVSGAVFSFSGVPVKSQKLMAVDIDLKGAATYRKVSSVKDLTEKGGYEYLGEATTDPRGSYTIKFFSWQYATAERGKADVVVFAIDGDTIIARSRLVNSEDYSAAGVVKDLNVTIPYIAPTQTEYSLLMGQLNPFLKESGVTLAAMASSADQVSFTASELGEDQSKIQIAVDAGILMQGHEGLSHELLYGIGRQQIPLSWPALYPETDDTLKKAIAQSSSSMIIGEFKDETVNAFLKALHGYASTFILTYKPASGTTPSLDEALTPALPQQEQRSAFLNAVQQFNGDYTDFWTKTLPSLPAFQQNPQLIDALAVNQQLSALTGNFLPLVQELQANRQVSDVTALMKYSADDWSAIFKKTGFPDTVTGTTDTDKAASYTAQIQGLLNAAYPTQKIALMLSQQQIKVSDANISAGIGTFLTKTQQFDFTSSRVDDFLPQIQAAAPTHAEDVRNELKRMQRVYQVSPTPEVMPVLLDKGLASAYSITSVPKQSFLQMYSAPLGGDLVAEAVYQMAGYISTKAAQGAMKMREVSHSLAPVTVISADDRAQAMTTLQNKVPDYAELFGSPDICACDDCRSVYSAAAYLVDIIRFLWRGAVNDDGKSPLDMFTLRRPDILNLPLTCENTNTIIPYIDLVNEIMEYYTFHGQLDSGAAYDTGTTTAEELRADPQNFNLEAYRIIKNAVYPFSLPYHQPLDSIRTYSDYLKVPRNEVMKAMQIDLTAPAVTAIGSEALKIGQEEYAVLTGMNFDGTADTHQLYEYFGFTNSADLEKMAGTGITDGIHEFLRRSGIAYTDLVALLETVFINPGQQALDFLQELFLNSTLSASDLYTRLQKINAGTLIPSADADIMAALNVENITSGDFITWVKNNWASFNAIITLYEPNSACELDTTVLRTVANVYAGALSSGIGNDSWSKTHRFIRLWKKLKWQIHDTDLVLAALGSSDIDPTAISQLSALVTLNNNLKLPLNQLATLWGNIDTYGDESLYIKLFINKTVQRVDGKFVADSFGNYLSDTTQVLQDHIPGILAAFRMSQDDLDAILGVALVVDGGTPRLINPATDKLSLYNLSTIYRFTVFAKALKWKVPDFCLLTSLFNAYPFSKWDLQAAKFTNTSTADTYTFYQLATAIQQARFKADQLQYIFTGTLASGSTIGLTVSKIRQAAAAISSAFAAIEQDNPDTPPSPLTADIISNKLSLTFQPDIVSTFMSLLDGTASFSTITDANLVVAIPPALAAKYSYIKGSGRLSVTGIMTDGEKSQLEGLANNDFKLAVDALYTMPEDFIRQNFGGIFPNINQAIATLLDHPAQLTGPTLADKWALVYASFIPLLKQKLRQDAITQHIASLIGLSEEATAVLIAGDMDLLITSLAEQGFSSTYYSDTTWTTSVMQRIDDTVDFDWQANAPGPLVPADNFSVRWKGYLSAPSSGEYTLIVDVDEQDESFNLYLDNALILQKAAGDTRLSWEVIVGLNASLMQLLTLEYVEQTGMAGITLSWKTATSAVEIIPAEVLIPATVIDDFSSLITLYHRSGKFVSGFQLTDAETAHLATYPADFGNFDFKAITPVHWQRINAYVNLRNGVPQSQAFLTDVFVAANTTNPAPAIAALVATLSLATAWDTKALNYLVNTWFVLGVNDFKNEIALARIARAIDFVSRTGFSADILAQWATPENDFDKLYSTAQTIKSALKARYEEEDWLQLAPTLSNTMRAHQREGLISYLLTRPELISWGAADADGLFEYFLIDVQMGSCMDTSRIVQATNSVQQFVSRCQLNLESDRFSGTEKGVSPTSMDADRWEWMKYYRVWEANREIFLYPENWLDPDWRDDKTPFFTTLESTLTQNDITVDNVESAFRDYLTSLNEVAHPEVCGVYQENNTDGSLLYLHVFARTHNAPYKYFYRTWDKYMKWSAWDSVQIDIRSVESGPDSGVHLIPVVWKNRLILFWTEFIEKQEPNIPNNKDGSSQTFQDISNQPASSVQSRYYWEIRLAWTEYKDGKWGPKQVTKEFLKEYETGPISAYRYHSSIDPGTQALSISLRNSYDDFLGGFLLADIQSRVIIVSTTSYGDPTVLTYTNFFMMQAKNGQLSFNGNTYLKGNIDHKLLYSSQIFDFSKSLSYPFFYQDVYRSYFVRPITVWLLRYVKNPRNYKPILVDNIKNVYYQNNPVGPGDPVEYLPITEGGDIIPVGLGQVMGGLATIGGQATTRALAAAPKADPAAVPQAKEAAAPQAKEAAATRSGLAAQQYLNEKIDGVTKLGNAFSGVYGIWNNPIYTRWINAAGMEFHTFYHPYSGRYVTNLNQGDIPGLLASDLLLPDDNGALFNTIYQPNTTMVPVPSDFATRTYYKENVCFDVYGANSTYNWELFFHAPLYIALRLSKNGKYEDARKWFHYIFDPTTAALPLAGESETSRYWQVLPFKTTPQQNLEAWFESLGPNNNPNSEDATIAEWQDNPFKPHLVARDRPIAYMKYVVIQYVQNLVEWADSLFRMDTMETVMESLQLYVMANHILGPRPQYVPKRGEIKAESYNSLAGKWDDFSNALVEMENIFPYSSNIPVSSGNAPLNLLGAGPALYFCIPDNDQLIAQWDTVADRLYKIRHCMDIDGVERSLALFAPPIDPGALINALSQGLSLGSILADLSSPPPIYRFTHLIQRANEFCGEVRSLGSALLSALEKKDGEQLARLRASQETTMVNLMTAIKERQYLEAEGNRAAIGKQRDAAAYKLTHYSSLLSSGAVDIPDSPTIDADLTADSPLPADTSVPVPQLNLDEGLVSTDDSAVNIISQEKTEMDLELAAIVLQEIATATEGIAGTMNFIPNFSAQIEPFGCGVTVSYGGSNIAGGISGLAKLPAGAGSLLSFLAGKSGKMAGYIRREQDWSLQANLAAKEIIQLDKQLTVADIRTQIAQKELDNLAVQIDNAQKVEDFLNNKFTGQELYQWMKEQLFAVYKQSYNMAYDMAKKVEQCYRYETGNEITDFIQFGYWDNTQQGLCSGEKLQLALRQLEKSFLEENKRELELVKSVSVLQLDPLALQQLRTNGACTLTLPEELFDIDYQGHYFRRIKSVSLSIPCIAGPFTSISCTLRLLKNTIRINTNSGPDDNYEHNNDEGVWTDDDRFRDSNVPVKAIAISGGQRDSGMFELNFRDERYLPFEGGGAISQWKIELTADKDLRQFDYSTISDVILHVSYTAREDVGGFKDGAVTYIKNFLINSAQLSEQPLLRMFSLKHEFPTEWYKFLNPAVAGSDQQLSITLKKEHFPFFTRDRSLVVTTMDLMVNANTNKSYDLLLTATDQSQEVKASDTIVTIANTNYDTFQTATIQDSSGALVLEDMDIFSPLTLKIKETTAADYKSIAQNPDELADLFIVLHYALA